MDVPALRRRLADFQCRRCGACCRKPGFVYVSAREAKEIAAFLKMPLRDFVNRFCDLQNGYYLVLKQNPDESCVFLTETGCSVHPAKPGQCRDFPIRWRTKSAFEYCEGLKEIFGRPSDEEVRALQDEGPGI